ncbi:MAG: HEAT repeat domain-containing protein [Treponema sp.]|jgi:plasmid stability protein|nr:HEAT repeat domain-containing protein [Treponema sp.]
MKKPRGLALLLSLLAVMPVAGQNRLNNGSGITMEETYLQKSVELMLIEEQSRSPSREMKESALKNIDTALQQGSTDRVILVALETLALEGILNKVVTSGRVVNNFPDLRVKAAHYLGSLGGAEAHKILLKMLDMEKYPMVVAEVIVSLGKIGLNPNDETAKLIAKKLTYFDRGYEDNQLALATVEAFERFAAQDGWKLTPETETILISISLGRYHATIRAHARQLLAKLRTYQPSATAAPTP